MRRLIVILLLWVASAGIAQETQPTSPAPVPVIGAPIQAEFSVDNTTPLLGERFTVTLEVIAAPGITIIDWVSFDEPLEVLEESDIVEEILPSGDIQYSRDYDVVLWDVGEYLSGELVVTYQQGSGVNAALVNSFFVQVPVQIPNPEEATLRPAAPTIELPYTSPLIFIGIGAGVIVALMLVARLIQISRRRVETIINATPAERAIAEIEDLKVQNLPPAVIYEMVASSLRHYLDGQYDLETADMTTIELTGHLREQELFSKTHQQRLQQVLEQADLVKFAKFQPDETSSMRLANFAVKWIRAVERSREHARV